MGHFGTHACKLETSAPGDFIVAVGDAVNRAVIVVRNEQRAVLHRLHVDRPADVLVVLQETSHERFLHSHRAVLVEVDDVNVAADLVGLVRGAVPRQKDRVAILRREHSPGIEAHAQRRRMRPELRNRLGELAAAVAPAEYRILDVAAVAVRKTEIVGSRVEQAVQLVLRRILGEPVPLVLGEIEDFGQRMKIHADDLADAAGDDLDAAAVDRYAANLGIARRRLTDVTRRSDIDVELIVGTERQEFPAVRLMVRQVAVDDDRIRRIIEIVLDLLELRDSRAFGDVERAVLEGEAVRPVEAGGDDFDLALAVAVDDGIDLVAQEIADEHGPLVADAQRTRVRDAAGIDLDFKTLRQLELRQRKIVGRRCKGRGGDALEFLRFRRRRHVGRRRRRRRTGRQRQLGGYRRDGAKEAERGQEDQAKTKTMTKTRGLNAHVLLPEHLSSPRTLSLSLSLPPRTAGSLAHKIANDWGISPPGRFGAGDRRQGGCWI